MIERLWSKGFLFGILITLFVVSLNFVKVDTVQQLMQRIEGILYDIRLLVTLPEEKRQFDEQVIIIDIDENSFVLNYYQ